MTDDPLHPPCPHPLKYVYTDDGHWDCSICIGLPHAIRKYAAELCGSPDLPDSPEDFEFQKLIAGEPENDVPRLVYAKYLEEKGDERGELIQLECEVTQLRSVLSQVEKRRRELRRQLWPLKDLESALRLLDAEGVKNVRRFIAEHNFQLPPGARILGVEIPPGTPLYLDIEGRLTTDHREGWDVVVNGDIQFLAIPSPES